MNIPDPILETPSTLKLEKKSENDIVQSGNRLMFYLLNQANHRGFVLEGSF